MQNCAAACGEIPLITLPTDECVKKQRNKNISRIVWKPCDVDIPIPETNIGYKALFDGGLLAFSSMLANVTWADPTTEDITIADCLPPTPLVTGRELTAQDRIKVESSIFSPAVDAKYRDYDFYQNKIDEMYNMNIGFEFCDGDVVWARDRDGNFLTASILVFLNYERSTGGSGTLFTEFKSLRVLFNGDPLALFNKPTWNRIEAGIVL